MNTSLAGFRFAESCFAQNQEVLHRDFRAEMRKLLHKRRHLVETFTGNELTAVQTTDSFKIFLINKGRERFFVSCGTGGLAEQSSENHIDRTSFAAQDIGFGNNAANSERSNVERNLR